jgi:hypothetical protein
MSGEITEKLTKMNLREPEGRHAYIARYKNDPEMILVGKEVESDDEHCVIPVRSENRYLLLRYKKHKK